MAKVYLLIGSDIESTSVLRAFWSPTSANRCAIACEEYEARRPQYPEHYEDTPECNAEFEKAEAKIERWRKRHPGGKRGYLYDSYTVCAMTVRP